MIKHISNIKNLYGAKHVTQQPRVMDFHLYTIFATAQMLHTISFYGTLHATSVPAKNCTVRNFYF